MKLSQMHTPDQVKAKSNAVDVKMQELKDAVDKNMPYDHIKFLVVCSRVSHKPLLAI